MSNPTDKTEMAAEAAVCYVKNLPARATFGIQEVVLAMAKKDLSLSSASVTKILTGLVGAKIIVRIDRYKYERTATSATVAAIDMRLQPIVKNAATPPQKRETNLTKRLRAALETFPPGKYKPMAIYKTLVMSNVAQPWELPKNGLSRVLYMIPGWSLEGRGHGAIWVRATPPAPPAPPVTRKLIEDDEPSHPTFNERVSRIERMLARLCEALQIPTD